jgi:hypothetical protein
VGNPGSRGLGHLVVDFQNNPFVTVVAINFVLVLSAYNREGFHDVVHAPRGAGNWFLIWLRSSDFSSKNAPVWPFGIRGVPSGTASR